MSEIMPGGWSAWKYRATPQSQQVFEKSLGALIGASYEEIAFATQVVEGTLWAFLSKTTLSDQMRTTFPTVAHVWEQPNGQTQITEIHHIGPMPSNTPGGWSSWDFSVNKAPQQSFDEATKNFLGVDLKAQAVTTQIVAGTNYVFLAKGTPVMPEATAAPYLVTIFQPLPGHGPAQLVAVKRINPGDTN